MREHPAPSVQRWSAATILSLMFLSATAQAATDQGVSYVQGDVQIRADTLSVAKVDGRDVTVAQGRFQLQLGKSVISGHNAVIWISRPVGAGPLRRDVTVYVEGEAKVVEPDGTSLSDRSILVKLHHEGRLFAEAKLADDSATPAVSGLLRRAAAARAGGARPRAGASVAAAAPQKAVPAVKGRSPATRPARPSKTAEGPEVMYYARKVSADMSRRPGQVERPVFLRGEVYLAQGDPASDMFLELRCDRAVVFVGTKSSPGASGAAVALGAGGRDSVRSVYLEGNVVIARGDRTLRGKRAFYDFLTGRAVILDSVFRAVQEQRGIPIFMRSPEARILSGKEFWFRSVRITTSDFYSPTYHLAAARAYMKDIAPYDEKGKRLGPEEWEVKLLHSRMNIRGVPISYWPYTHVKGELFHTSLRSIQMGNQGQNFGYGVETEWELFSLLGLTRPKRFDGRFEMSYYSRGVLAGVNLKYSRPRWSGYTMAYGLIDNRGRDDFGETRTNFNIPNYRGRFTHRHKQFLPGNWQVQGEFSWYSDAGFPEAFFPSEFYSGKEQETLLYAKHQEDNRVFTALGQYRLNRFDTQTESSPDLAYHLIGESLAGDRMVLFSETRAGIKRWRPAKASKTATRRDSRQFVRFDARDEINWPLRAGPVKIVPYATVRATYWQDAPAGVGEKWRPYGQVGTRASFDVWRIYNGAESRLWDVHRLKHVVTPEVAAFASDTAGVSAAELYPIDPDVEEHLTRQSGYSVGIRQRLLTKRGKPGQRETSDWMRLDVAAGRFRNGGALPADGRFFMYRPEYSLARDYVNADYLWNISSATTLLADANYDTHTGKTGRASAGLNVRRSPRLSYFTGIRYIGPINSNVATLGTTYELTRKYSVTFFEQYDLAYKGGDNMSTRLGLTRKFPRWYVGLTAIFDQDGEGDDIGLYLTLWPEGMPEVKIGNGSRGIFTSSSLN